MVLVDTSVWIRFLRGTQPYAAGMDRLLSRDEVLGHDFVYGELLIGDLGGRTRLLATYSAMHQAVLVAHREVVELVRHRRLNGRGIGWTDAHILASTLVEHTSLWTADESLARAAADLRVAYAVPP